MSTNKLYNQIFYILLLMIMCSFPGSVKTTNYFKSLFGIKDDNKNTGSTSEENLATTKNKPINQDVQTKKDNASSAKFSNKNGKDIGQFITNIKNATEFDNEVLTQKIAIVKFGAKLCPPCIRLKFVLDKIAKEYSGKIKFFEIDVDENQEMTKKYNIQSIPVILFLENGQEKGITVGGISEKEFRSKIKEYLKL